MLRRDPALRPQDTELSPRTRSLSWTALLADVVVLGFLARAGSWLDTTPWLSMITLGGHHRIVMGLALGGLLLLTGLAPTTHGFVRANRTQLVLLPVAAVLSLAAVAGLVSVVALGAVAVLVAALLFRPEPRTRVDLIRRIR
jgi:hypothetical protein